MKKFLSFFTLVLLTVVLGACNTTGENNQGAADNQAANVNTNKNEEKLSGNDSVTATDTQQTDTNSMSTEKTLLHVRNNEKISETATLIESDNQNFVMYVLPGYTLSAEEPGKDVLLFDDNGEISMRIETVALNESNYSDMLQSTVAFMEAGSTTGKTQVYSDIAPFQSEKVKNVNGFVNDFGKDRVTALLFETEDFFVRLTVFDSKEEDLTNALFTMGTTITAKK